MSAPLNAGKGVLRNPADKDRSLDEQSLHRIVEMAWEDRTSFEAIELQFGLLEKEVIALMRSHLKPSSFRMWRKRTHGRSTKHAALRAHKTNDQTPIATRKSSL